MLEFFQDRLKPIEIQRNEPIKSGYGGSIDNWLTHTIVNGYIRTLGGNERVSEGKTEIFSTHRMVCEDADINHAHRVVDNNQVYDIKLIDKRPSGHMQIDLEYRGVKDGV